MEYSCPTDVDVCTISTCSIQCGQVKFIPTLSGNVAYATIMGLLLLAQLFLGIKFRTWGFMVGMVCGLILEVIGYAGRILLHYNPFDFNNFLLYLIPLTIGPAFLSGSIYLCLIRIVVVYGQNISRLRPRTYAIVFMTCDFFSLILQGAGGGISATADTVNLGNIGRYVMIAGLAFQVFSLSLFMILWLDFSLRLKSYHQGLQDARFVHLREGTGKFKAFIYALWLATILILIRSIYRVVELQSGYSGTVANNEVAFMILEGPMIFIAVLLLAILHPGIAFDGYWQAASWSLKQKTVVDDESPDGKESAGIASR